jgi:hypothetical protein
MNLSKGFDIVLDFHNTHCPKNDCGFVGDNQFQNTLKVATFLELNRVNVADYDCINKYVANCLSVEISLDSDVNSLQFWVEKIKSLVNLDLTQTSVSLDLYEFVGRISSEKKELVDAQNWVAFQPISPSDLKILELEAETMPIFIHDSYTPQNLCGLVKFLDNNKT